MEEAAEEMESLAEPHPPLQAVLLSLWWVLPTPELVLAAALECPCTYISGSMFYSSAGTGTPVLGGIALVSQEQLCPRQRKQSPALHQVKV